MRKFKLFYFFSFAITALAVMLLSSTRTGQAVFPPAPNLVSQNYVIKLISNDLAVLTPWASQVEQKFTFTQNPQFQNIYSFRSPASLAFLQQQLQGHYQYLDLDRPVETRLETQAVRTTDPGFTSNPLDTERQWALPKAGFLSAWERTTGSTGVKVAVIDTGIDHTHEDLRRARFEPGFNLLTDETIPPRTNSDDNGHGTLMTGVIAATPNNRLGITGAAWRVTIVPVKALNARGSGTSSNLSEAIVWAVDNEADIINMSLGGLGLGHDTTLSHAIAYAYRKNVLIVAAAGNDVAVTGGNLDHKPVFPVCDDNGENMVLGVTATDVTDRKPEFANYGKACIDVSAPGRRILSTTNHDPGTGAPAPNAYAYASGTSLAVPYVVGQAVLLKTLFPSATPAQLRDRIIATATNIDQINPLQCQGSCSGLLGAGRINVSRSMADEILTKEVQEGDLVRVAETGAIYLITGGKRRLVSPFVLSQRFAHEPISEVSSGGLFQFPEGSYAEPLDGTLIKLPNDPTVFYMSKGLRLPVTGQVFAWHRFAFSQVNTLSAAEVNSWLLGSFLPPPEGSLVRTIGSPTVYWVAGGVLHPINFAFYRQRGLEVFPVLYISEQDLLNFPKGDAFLL